MIVFLEGTCMCKLNVCVGGGGGSIGVSVGLGESGWVGVYMWVGSNNYLYLLTLCGYVYKLNVCVGGSICVSVSVGGWVCTCGWFLRSVV